MDKELKPIGGGRHSTRLELPTPSKKSHRIRELETLSQNAINKTQDGISRREGNMSSKASPNQRLSKIDLILEDAWASYLKRKQIQEEEGYLRPSSSNSRSMSFSDKKKEEHRFENREGLKDCEQR